jgi:hypothetical protein
VIPALLAIDGGRGRARDDQSCYDRRMKRVIAMALALAACTGPKPKPESPFVNEGSDVPESCCCKSSPLTSEDGKPVYDMLNRMECSTRHGECMPDVQCNKGDAPPAGS